MIGGEAVARTEVIKKVWDYVKANGLKDAPVDAVIVGIVDAVDVEGKIIFKTGK